MNEEKEKEKEKTGERPMKTFPIFRLVGKTYSYVIPLRKWKKQKDIYSS